MLKILFSTLLIFMVAQLSAEEYFRKINWSLANEHAGVEAADFEGSVIVGADKLPHWFESIEIVAPRYQVIIKDAVFEALKDTAHLVGKIDNPELKYRVEKVRSSGKSYAKITVLPFVRRSRQIEKLVSFSVEVKEDPVMLKSATATHQWKSSSVLSSGKWIKISTKARGIYKISFDQLQKLGFANPDQVSMYGNGGYKLAEQNSDIQFDDLSAYPIWKGKDNSGKNCLFFFSTGNVRLVEDSQTGRYSHEQNPYSFETYFYLTDVGNPLLISKNQTVYPEADTVLTTFPNYTFYEKEAVNLVHSGSRWFGEHFINGTLQSAALSFDSPDPSVAARFRFNGVGRSSAISTMAITLDGTPVKGITFFTIDVGRTDDVYADERFVEVSLPASSAKMTARMTYSASTSSSEAWLDYIGVNYRSLLNMNADVLMFRGKGVQGKALLSKYVLSGASASTKIFDITDINNVFEVSAEAASGKLSFITDSPVTRDYVAFNPDGAISTPDFVEEVKNQNLHASAIPEMIIVSNKKLLSAANELAQFHQVKDQMNVLVVTPDLVYNEFSGGLPDPSGLRNFFRMYYDRGNQGGSARLKYVLLMGDGTYDNRDILGKHFNLLPTYQSEESINAGDSFVTDDFFAFLDEEEGGSSGAVDIGIGRIPANTLGDAEAVVDKIIHYYDPETFGNWRNVVTFIGDDGNTVDGFTNLHQSQSETIASTLVKNYPSFFTDKIYFDSYQKIKSAGGEKYPEVSTSISNRIKLGTLIMNYTGHANERNLADEAVLDIGTINSWSNYNRLPIFVTATCDYSRFDADETSAGEHILFNPAGGGVGLFSTTRLVYSGANFRLNREFFNYIFSKDGSGNNLRLGDVMRQAKTTANTGANQLNFTLMADPAMELAVPEFQVYTTAMNGLDISEEADTISSMSVVTVKGFVADKTGKKLTDFNGEIVPTVYDKSMKAETLGNSGQQPMSYTVQNNVIYKGLASVKNGEFEFTFFVPKDISFKTGKGRILYYAYDQTRDAFGNFDNFYIGGTSDAPVSDLQGPEMDVFMNSRSFKEGQTVSASSVLLVDVSDETGVNTTGTGIGHDITAVLDDDNSNVLVLNEYFRADKDSYTSGKIVFPLSNLSEGEHVIKVKIWDVLNNSSEKEIRFFVKDDFKIESVSCYPNPVQSQTSFVFIHNQPDETMDMTLEVFEVSGALVDIVKTKIGSVGTESLPLEWIPANRNVKMRPGAYIYRISVKNGERSASGSGRLVYLYR